MQASISYQLTDLMKTKISASEHAIMITALLQSASATQAPMPPGGHNAQLMMRTKS
jgi:hypothetical protein